MLAFAVASIAAVWALTSASSFWRLYGTLGLILATTTIAVIVAARSRRAPAGQQGVQIAAE